MSHLYKLVMEVSAPSLKAVKQAFHVETERIIKQPNPQLWSFTYASNGGWAPESQITVSVQVELPIQERIKSLREEADNLEAKLKEGKI